MPDESAVRALRHRMVNDLNLVHGLLALAERRVEDGTASAVLAATKDRVRAIALVHRLAWSAREHEPLARVDVQRLLGELATDSVRATRHTPEPELGLELDALELSFDAAVALGLLVRELVSNASAHAFPQGRAGAVRVRLRRLDAEQVELSVEDDGVGSVDGFRSQRENGLGLLLTELLAEQLGGRFQLGPRLDGGTRAELTFQARNGP